MSPSCCLHVALLPFLLVYPASSVVYSRLCTVKKGDRVWCMMPKNIFLPDHLTTHEDRELNLIVGVMKTQLVESVESVHLKGINEENFPQYNRTGATQF